MTTTTFTRTALLLGLLSLTTHAIAQAAPKPIDATRAIEIALARVPGTVEEVEREHELRRDLFEVEIRSKEGAEYEVRIDASTGEVIEVRLDD